MREVLILREFEDLSYRQIAEIIDAPIAPSCRGLPAHARLWPSLA